MQVKAEGRLRHCFFGEYIARVALGFADAASAADAKRVLGDKWTVGEKHPNALVWSGSREELDALKAQFASEGFELKFPPCGYTHKHRDCKDMKTIDSIEHSIDYGPKFFLTVPIQAAQEQAGLFK